MIGEAQRDDRSWLTMTPIRLTITALDDNGHWPARLEELIERSYIRDLPQEDSGPALAYDRRTGRVSSSADRVLGGD